MSEPSQVDAAARLLDGLAKRDEPLGPRTTYRVGGAAALFVEIGSEDDLGRVAHAVAASGIDVLAVGKGSNMLVADAGFPGLAVALGDGFARVELADQDDEDAVSVVAGAAAALPVTARQTVRWGLHGFEWAVGVPGSIGGAVRMNAGGHGAEMADVLLRARLLDLRTGHDGWTGADDLALSYRQSSVAAHQLVLAAELGLRRGDRAAGEQELSEIVAWRRANQPGGQNAGSVFTNPEGDSAGRLVEAAGCKGLRVGSAEVSPKHANFFQADRDGSADDVLALMREVQQRVREAFGIELHPETHLVGFSSGQFGTE